MIYNDVVLPARVESPYYKSKKKENSPRFGVPKNLAPFHPRSIRLEVLKLRSGWPLPVGNEGPSTFTAWYIGDENSSLIPY